MSGNKQQKLSSFVKKVSTTSENNSDNDETHPMEDVDTHTMTQQEKAAYSQQCATSNHNTFQHPDPNDGNGDDDVTLIAGNDPPPLTLTRCDMKITIKGTMDNNYLEALRNIQNFFTQVQRVGIYFNCQLKMRRDFIKKDDITKGYISCGQVINWMDQTSVINLTSI